MGMGTHFVFAYHIKDSSTMALITHADSCNTNFICGWLLSMKPLALFNEVLKQTNIWDYNSQWDLTPIWNM